MLERIPKSYVCEDCLQVRIAFNDVITLISSDFLADGILCHYDLSDDSQNVNNYLLDNRKNIFPYANIPIYKEWDGNLFDGFYKKNYINQLLEFNKHYITVVNGTIKDRYVVKDGNEAIVYSRILKIPSDIEERLINKNDFLNELKSNVIFCIDKNGHYVDFKKNFTKFISNNGGLLILNIDGNIVFRLIDVDFGCTSCFTKEYNIPFNDYQLEELKFFESKIEDVKNPKIYSCINPNIDRRDIRTAKKMVRKLSRNK